MYKLKYIFTVLAFFLVHTHLLAQHLPKDTLQGEIWMTEAELESFLTRLAIRKKQQLQKRQLAELRAASSLTMGANEINKSALIAELERLHARIDLLEMNKTVSSTDDRLIGNDNRLLKDESTSDLRGVQTLNAESELINLEQQIERLRNEIATLQDNATSSPYSRNRRDELSSIQRVLDNLDNRIDRQRKESNIARQLVLDGALRQGSTPIIPVPPIYIQSTDKEKPMNHPDIVGVDSLLVHQLKASTSLNMQLQQQIDSLYANLYGHPDSTQQAVAAEHLVQRIDALTKRIDQLTVVAESAKDASNNAVTAADSERTTMAKYQHTVYFANNSTTIGDQDIIALQQLGNKINNSPHRATVILRGYSSTVGNAAYNEQLSRRRAEAVKKILMQYGLDAKHIVTLYHGADDSRSDDLARRVEITLSLYE